jgi:hypothetical protein
MNRLRLAVQPQGGVVHQDHTRRPRALDPAAQIGGRGAGIDNPGLDVEIPLELVDHRGADRAERGGVGHRHQDQRPARDPRRVLDGRGRWIGRRRRRAP